MNLQYIICSLQLSMLLSICGVLEVYGNEQADEYVDKREQILMEIDKQMDNFDEEEDSYNLHYSQLANYLTEEDFEMENIDFVKSRVVRDARERNHDKRKGRGNQRQHAKTTTEPPAARQRKTGVNGRRNKNNPLNQPANAQNECVHCKWREHRRKVRLDTIKQDILRKINMKSPPNFTVDVESKAIEVLKQLHRYNDSRIQSEAPVVEEEIVDSTQIATFAEAPPASLNIFERSQFDSQTSDLMYFKLEHDILQSSIHEARLFIYIKPYDLSGEYVTHLRLFRIIKKKLDEDYTIAPTADISKKLLLTPEHTGKWYELNFTSVLEKWMSPCIHHTCPAEYENYGLYVSCKDGDGQNFAVVLPQNEEEQTYKPFLQTKQTDLGNIRRKRRLKELRDCKADSLETRCCRYPLIVNFDLFGWDWIIQPRSYQAFYCSGDCPYAYRSNTAHTHLVHLSKDQGMPGGPCCTPVKMSNQSIIYYDESKRVVLKNLPDMVVDLCGCN